MDSFDAAREPLLPIGRSADTEPPSKERRRRSTIAISSKQSHAVESTAGSPSEMLEVPVDALGPETSWDDYADRPPGVQIISDPNDDDIVVDVREELDLAFAPAFLDRMRVILDRPVRTLTI